MPILSPRVVKATRFVRKMRGETKAQLLAADDGNSYVVKYRNNPFGPRILVNELTSALFLRALDIPAPETALVVIDEQVLVENPEMEIRSRGGSIPVLPGPHFGSRHAGFPEERAVYDFLPDKLLCRVSNLADFRRVLVYDKWASNGDFRQAVFYRGACISGETAFSAEMIDHGLMFHGAEWTFRDSPPQGICSQLEVYGTDLTMRDLDPCLSMAMELDNQLLADVVSAIPREWIEGDEIEFTKLLFQFLARRERLPEMLNETLSYIRSSSQKKQQREPAVRRRQDPEECFA
jgi:hypothetical protein